MSPTIPAFRLLPPRRTLGMHKGTLGAGTSGPSTLRQVKGRESWAQALHADITASPLLPSSIPSSGCLSVWGKRTWPASEGGQHSPFCAEWSDWEEEVQDLLPRWRAKASPPARLQARSQVLQEEVGLKSKTEPCSEGLLTLGIRRWDVSLFSLLAPCCPSTRKTMFDILIPWEKGPNALDSYKALCPFPPHLARTQASPRLIPSMCVCTWPGRSGAALAVYAEVPKAGACGKFKNLSSLSQLVAWGSKGTVFRAGS